MSACAGGRTCGTPHTHAPRVLPHLWPSIPPAMRPQMRCLSLPPAPAPSSCHTTSGGFSQAQPRAGILVVRILPAVKCRTGIPSPFRVLGRSDLALPLQRQGVRGETPLCCLQLCGHRHRHEPLGRVRCPAQLHCPFLGRYTTPSLLGSGLCSAPELTYLGNG